MADDAPLANAGEILGGDLEGQKVAFRGWIYRTRSSGKLVFWVLRDVTGTVQATIHGPTVGDEPFAAAKAALVEASVMVEGTVAKDDRAPGGYELQVSKVDVVGEAEKFPITKDQSEEYLRDMRHLWLRSRKLSAIMKVRSTMTGAMPSEGSSRSSNLGLPMSVRAIVSICCSPPDSSLPRLPRRSFRFGNRSKRTSTVHSISPSRAGWRPTSKFSRMVRSVKMRRSSGT